VFLECAQRCDQSADINTRSIHEKFYFMDTDGSSRKQTSQPHCSFAPGTYITLIYMKQRYPIRKQDLHDQERLSKSPFFIIDTLFFPSTASFDDFGILYSYLKNGKVAPTRAATRNFSANALPYGSSLSIIEKQGPPVMLQPKANSMPYLAASIAAYKLGNTLHFESLKHSAISRLYGLPCTSEDPIPLLEQVYKSEQDLALPVRVWAKDWLARPTDASLPSEYANTYPTNLHFLQRHPELVARFSRLVQNTPDLAWDITTLTADTARSQASADGPCEQGTWLPKQTGTFLPFVNLPAPPHLNRSDQWPYQTSLDSRLDELYRKRQELEAAQRQYMFDIERGVLPERPMAYAGSLQHGQVHDANLVDRMRDLHMGNPRP